jgi:beta-lactam-binding protein with PASTA domain
MVVGVGWLRTAPVAMAVVAVSVLSGCHSGHSAARGTARNQLVTVPAAAARSDIFGAYDALHRLGLRVTLTRQADVNSLDGLGVKLSPSVGTRVLRGTTVKITPAGVAIGSPAVLTSDPHYVVPNFAGQPPSSAVRWATRHDMYWAVDLSPITASEAPHLLDAYGILSQQPRAGATITQGVTVGRGFRPTPLTLTLTPK